MTKQINLETLQKWSPQAAAALFLLCLYVFTSLDTVTMEDSGIFLVASYFAGIPQPTGYPLYIVLGKLFSLLPMGTVAFRIHLLNSVLGVAGCWLVYRIVYRLAEDRSIAFFSALILGVSGSFWFQAVVAEVYMLNTCLFLLVLYGALELSFDYSRKTLAWVSFCYGLALSNHLPLTILASGAFPALLWYRKKELLRDSGIIVVFLSLSLLPYLHLLTAHFHSEFLFLYPIRNFSDLYDYLSRQNYSGIDVLKTASLTQSVEFLIFFSSRLTVEFSILAFPVVIVGFVSGWFLQKKSLMISLTLGLLSSSFFLLIFWRTEHTDLTREFYQYCQLIPLSVCAVLFGNALLLLKTVPQIPRKIARMLPAVVGGICVVAALFFNFPRNDLKNDTFAYDYARLVLDHLPENSVLILNDDSDTGPVGYTHFVEGIRPDLLVTSQVGVLFPRKMFETQKHPKAEDRRVPILDFVSRQFSQRRRVFTTASFRYFNNETARFPLHYQSHGLYFEITEESAEPVVHRALIRDARMILDKYGRGEYREHWSFFRDALIAQMTKLLLEAGQHHPVFDSHRESILIRAQMLNAHQKKYREADHLFARLPGTLSGLYLVRQVEINRQFLVNRLNWLNAGGMTNLEKNELIQEAVDITTPMAKKYPFCENKLALNLVQISRQLPVDFDDEYFKTTFSDCEEFKPFL